MKLSHSTGTQTHDTQQSDSEKKIDVEQRYITRCTFLYCLECNGNVAITMMVVLNTFYQCTKHTNSEYSEYRHVCRSLCDTYILCRNGVSRKKFWLPFVVSNGVTSVTIDVMFCSYSRYFIYLFPTDEFFFSSSFFVLASHRLQSNMRVLTPVEKKCMLFSFSSAEIFNLTRKYQTILAEKSFIRYFTQKLLICQPKKNDPILQFIMNKKQSDSHFGYHKKSYSMLFFPEGLLFSSVVAPFFILF